MAKSKVYTKTGDSGETSLVGGQRVSKAELQIELYGTIDELNSFIGLAISKRKEGMDNAFTVLEKIQPELFVVGSNVACLKEDRVKYKLADLSEDSIKHIESTIDLADAKLEKLVKFVMPTGSEFAATLHVCRTITRRVERLCYRYKNECPEEVSQNYLTYFNRLSDLFFILARLANKEAGIKETLWS